MKQGVNIYIHGPGKYYAAILNRFLNIKHINIVNCPEEDFTSDLNQVTSCLQKCIYESPFKNNPQSLIDRQAFFYPPYSSFKDIHINSLEIEKNFECFFQTISDFLEIHVSSSNPDFLTWTFQKFLNRSPTNSELKYHVMTNKQYNVSVLTWILNIYLCPESHSIGLAKTIEHNVICNKKIAIILPGHTRNTQAVLTSQRQILYHPNFDVFIHTWSDTGYQNNNWTSSWLDPSQQEVDCTIIKRVYNPISYIQENNKELLQSFSFVGKIYPIFLFESQARDDATKYINSQLYSIYRSYGLVEEYELVNNIKYDGILKMRFDLDINKIDIQQLVTDCSTTESLYFPHAQYNHHSHFGGGGGCLSCDSASRKNTQHSKHSNDICDLWYYGKRDLMKYPCEIYLHALEILKKSHPQNLQVYPHIPHFQEGDFVYIQGKHIEGDIVCFYPERMLREYLIGMSCKSSCAIHSKINRSKSFS